jgi:methionine sulfoxide reductase heme-binding subunit
MKKAALILRGWPIVGVAASIIVATVAALWLATPDAVAALRASIRVTARFSVTLFLLAFTASALWRFCPNAWTRWLRQQRRYIGVSFAVSHFIHLIAILTLRAVAPAELADVPTVTWVFGGLAYVFIAAMAATSFDRTAQALDPRAWTMLHTAGSYYVWLIFANSYFSRALMMPEYIPIAVLLGVALGLRIAARIARTRVRQPVAAG